MNNPTINVTPLIDVLLVLLIIFMVVAPLRPSSFKTRIPSEPDHDRVGSVAPDALAVIVGRDFSLRLNGTANIGTVDEPEKLVDLLRDTFAKRIANNAVSSAFDHDPNRPFTDRIERTVFIKAPRTIDYGSVARVVDAVKLAGAYPISLQIDALE